MLDAAIGEGVHLITGDCGLLGLGADCERNAGPWVLHLPVKGVREKPVHDSPRLAAKVDKLLAGAKTVLLLLAPGCPVRRGCARVKTLAAGGPANFKTRGTRVQSA